MFEPVRPVVANPMTRFYDDTTGGTLISDPLTHQVADLFNVALRHDASDAAALLRPHR